MAREIAAEIAAKEERAGHRTAARRLKGALSQNGSHAFDRDPQYHRNGTATFLSAALARQTPTVKLEDVSLPAATRSELKQIVREYRLASKLQRAGIGRRSKILFWGPPGCGKSMAAHALARELKLQLCVVRFDALIGGFLGQTASNLRQLFQFAEANPCVMLFDEIDALGKQRGNPADVGELDRIVIALMQELELSVVRGLVVATSNLPDCLDRALWRRFDLQVHFPAPEKHERVRFAAMRAKSLRLAGSKPIQHRAARVPSYAEIAKLVEDEARRRALRSGR
ncbi:MAG: AAA family ATPase [Gemmataceae bacterium]